MKLPLGFLLLYLKSIGSISVMLIFLDAQSITSDCTLGLLLGS
jgi:hypothetical protein